MLQFFTKQNQTLSQNHVWYLYRNFFAFLLWYIYTAAGQSPKATVTVAPKNTHMEEDTVQFAVV